MPPTARPAWIATAVAALLASALPAQEEEGETRGTDWPEHRYGEYLRELGPWNQPGGVAIAADGTLYRTEGGTGHLVAIDPEGELLTRDGFDRPTGVAVDARGRVLVADTGNDRIRVLDGGDWADYVGFRRPMDVAASGDRLYVADTGNARVVVVSDQPRVLVIGGYGTGDGRFQRPVAVAVDPDGDLYVVDAGQHRIQKFDAAGKFLTAWGGFGPHAGLFGHPADVAWHEGRVYVADADNHRVQVFEPDGTPIYEWGKHALRPREGEGSLHYPNAIAIAPDGAFVVVAEGFQDRAQVFGPTGRDPALFSTDPGILPWKVSPHYGRELATAGDLLVLFEPETQILLIHDLELDEPVEVCKPGGYGDAPGFFHEIAGVAIDPANRSVIVSDRGRRALQIFELDHEPDAPLRFDPRMARLSQAIDLNAMFAAAGRDELHDVEPGALARDRNGNLALVDRRGNRVIVLTPKLRVARTIDDLDEPVDLAFGPQGERLYVVERGSRRLRAFDAAGNAVAEFGDLTDPHGVAVDAAGNVYATDAGEHRVTVFDADAGILRQWGGKGLGAGEFYRPRGIGVDARGRVIVLDHGNHRGQIFTAQGEFLVAFGPRLYVRPTRKAR